MLSLGNRIDIKYISGLLANKYVLTFVVFVIWMLFFDKNNLFVVHDLQETIESMEAEKHYYDSELSKLDERMHAIEVERERYAREQFFLHREDEIVYLIR